MNDEVKEAHDLLLQASAKLLHLRRLEIMQELEPKKNLRGRTPLPGAPEPVYTLPDAVDTKERCFFRQVFLGSGDLSGQKVAALRERLEYAIECLGCIQLSESDEELAEIPNLPILEARDSGRTSTPRQR